MFYNELPHVKRVVKAIKKLAKIKGYSILEYESTIEVSSLTLVIHHPKDMDIFHKSTSFREIGKPQGNIYGTIFDLYKYVKKAPSLI